MDIKVCIINIGNELLLGQTVNTNLSWLGIQLAEIGLPISSSVTIKDEPLEIKRTLLSAWSDNDIVIITGGLGPTDDDLTKGVIADCFGKKLEFKQDVWQNVEHLFKRRNIKIPENNRSQAMVPIDFTALLNSVGTAPGLYYTEAGKSLFALPGVPIEMKTLFKEHIKKILVKSYSVRPIFIKTLHTWNISESSLAEKLNHLHTPPGVSFAWLPQTGRVDLRIYGVEEKLVFEYADLVAKEAQKWIWGVDTEKPQTVLQKLMLDKGVTLSVAESCTGGMVQELLTGVPGSSGYYIGGVVSYSNDMKEKSLKVSHETLDKYGAVSIETASEMAIGIRKLTNSTLGISVTGIAGPDGGSDAKPVGTVCFSISDESQTITKIQVFNGDRQSVRWKAAEYIILLLIEKIRSTL